jgi:hypothetical protein
MDHEKPHQSPSNRDRKQYYDDADDHAARVRRAKEAAQRQIEAFGDRSKYQVRKIYGRRTDIDYSRPPKKQEATVAPAAPAASTVSQESSGKEAQTNAHRESSLEFGSGVASEES